MVNIRDGHYDDIPWLLDNLKSFADFYNTKISLFGNEEHSKQYLTNILENHYLIISEVDNVRTGFIAGLLVLHPFNPKIKLLQELWWWVPEEFRGTRCGSKLFSTFVKFGEKFCDMTSFTLEEHSPVSDTFLIRNGFVRKEIQYVREN